VVVHAGAEKAQLRIGIGIPCRERAQVLEHVLFGHAIGQVERPVEANLGGDLLEELRRRAGADLSEHRLAV
jgi:hypothetical protein